MSVSNKIKEKLLYVIEVELEENPADHSIVLNGDMYKIELAWNTINQSLQTQHKIHSKIYQNQDSWDGDRERTRSRPDSRSSIDGGTFTVQHDSLSSKMNLSRESHKEYPHDVYSQNSLPYAPSMYMKDTQERVIPNTSTQGGSITPTKGRSDKRERDMLTPKKSRSGTKERVLLSPSAKSDDEDDISSCLLKTSEPIVRPKTSSYIKANHWDMHETSPMKYDDGEPIDKRSPDYENIKLPAPGKFSIGSHDHVPNTRTTMLGEICDDMTEEEELQKIFKSSKGSSDSERSRQANDTFKEFSSTTDTIYPFPREKTTGNTSLFSTDFAVSSYQEFIVGNLKVAVTLQDITAVETDGLVNAANGSLSHAGGVAGAISRAADIRLETECEDFIRRNGNLRTTNVMHTIAGGRLKVKYIIHAVGPIWLESRPDRCTWELIKTYLNCFEYANSTLRISSVSVPCISSGNFQCNDKVYVSILLIAIY